MANIAGGAAFSYLTGRIRAGLRARGCANSFEAGTQVLMADGTTKAIEDIQVGDWVWAEDPETGEAGPHQVQATIVGRGEKHLVDIEIDGHTITATDNHPIWVECCKSWFDAAALEPGFEVRTAAGYTLDVDAVQSYTVPHTAVYNLTVAGLHTYFVVAGDVSVLVHNCPNEINHGRPPGGRPNEIGHDRSPGWRPPDELDSRYVGPDYREPVQANHGSHFGHDGSNWTYDNL